MIPSLVRMRRVQWTPRAWTLAVGIVALWPGCSPSPAYLAWLTGNPFQWSAQHAAWGRTFTGRAPFVDVAGKIADKGVGSYVSMARTMPST